MAALIDLAELEAALGYTFDTPESQAQAQYYINTISAFINKYVDVSFEFHENATIRYKADWYGTITLVGPVDSVSGVVRPNSDSVICFLYDDIDLIYNLCPNTAYDVTYSYGYAEVPEDVKSVVIEGVRASINNPNNALSYRVGDVTETYLANAGNSVASPIVVLGQDVLDSYKNTAFTVSTFDILPLPSTWGI